jgi:ACR3 family arsenite efflux pump ArsB
VVLPGLYIIGLRLFWNRTNLGAIVYGLVITFFLLDVLWLAMSWSLGVSYQGLIHTALVTAWNAVGLAVVFALSWYGFRNASKRMHVASFTGVFVMLAWCAFPYLGEML